MESYAYVPEGNFEVSDDMMMWGFDDVMIGNRQILRVNWNMLHELLFADFLSELSMTDLKYVCW